MKERKQETERKSAMKTCLQMITTLPLPIVGNLATVFIDTVVSSSSSPTRGLVYLCLKLIAGTVTE